MVTGNQIVSVNLVDKLSSTHALIPPPYPWIVSLVHVPTHIHMITLQTWQVLEEVRFPGSSTNYSRHIPLWLIHVVMHSPRRNKLTMLGGCNFAVGVHTLCGCVSGCLQELLKECEYMFPQPILKNVCALSFLLWSFWGKLDQTGNYEWLAKEGGRSGNSEVGKSWSTYYTFRVLN